MAASHTIEDKRLDQDPLKTVARANADEKVRPDLQEPSAGASPDNVRPARVLPGPWPAPAARQCAIKTCMIAILICQTVCLPLGAPNQRTPNGQRLATPVPTNAGALPTNSTALPLARARANTGQHRKTLATGALGRGPDTDTDNRNASSTPTPTPATSAAPPTPTPTDLPNDVYDRMLNVPAYRENLMKYLIAEIRAQNMSSQLDASPVAMASLAEAFAPVVASELMAPANSTLAPSATTVSQVIGAPPGNSTAQHHHQSRPYLGDFFFAFHNVYWPFHCVTCLIICTLGIFANVTNIIVLTR